MRAVDILYIYTLDGWGVLGVAWFFLFVCFLRRNGLFISEMAVFSLMLQGKDKHKCLILSCTSLHFSKNKQNPPHAQKSVTIMRKYTTHTC